MTQQQFEESRLDREESDVDVHVDTAGVERGAARAARAAS
jgi:hypothetical protein